MIILLHFPDDKHQFAEQLTDRHLLIRKRHSPSSSKKTPSEKLTHEHGIHSINTQGIQSKTYWRSYYRKNANKYHRRNRRYYREHCEEIKKQNQKYRLTHCEELKDARRRYVMRNRSVILSKSKRYYRRNRIKLRAYRKKYWRDKHVEIKDRARQRPHHTWALNTIYDHRKRGFKIVFTSAELEAIASQTRCCSICNVILNWGNTTGRPQLNSPTLDRKTNAHFLTLTNTWIICFRCNLTKQNRTFVEFVRYCKKVVDNLKSDEHDASRI
jgi:hypothetical protein